LYFFYYVILNNLSFAKILLLSILFLGQKHRAKGTKRIRREEDIESGTSNDTFRTIGDSDDEAEGEAINPNFLRQQQISALNATEHPVYIESFELDINSAPISQFRSENTEDECVGDFIRFLNTNAFMGSLLSNSIDYQQYRCGFYIAAFDLTTAQDGGLDQYSVPATMKGAYF
jgi:hypothetical protein